MDAVPDRFVHAELGGTVSSIHARFAFGADGKAWSRQIRQVGP